MRKGVWRRECEEGSMVLGRGFVGEILRKGVWRREFKEKDREERV